MTKIQSMDAAQDLFQYLDRAREGETIEITDTAQESVYLVSKEMMDQLSMALDTCVRVKNQIGHLKEILEQDMLPTVETIDKDVAKSLFPA